MVLFMKRLYDRSKILEYPETGSAQKSVLLFEENSFYTTIENNNTIERGDKYLFELLKRNFKLERQLANTRLEHEKIGYQATTTLQKQNTSDYKARKPVPVDDEILKLFLARVNGWVLLANSLKQDESTTINFETCGLKCSTFPQLCTELLNQARLFSK